MAEVRVFTAKKGTTICAGCEHPIKEHNSNAQGLLGFGMGSWPCNVTGCGCPDFLFSDSIETELVG